MDGFALTVTLGFSNKPYENILKNLLEMGNFTFFNIDRVQYMNSQNI